MRLSYSAAYIAIVSPGNKMLLPAMHWLLTAIYLQLFVSLHIVGISNHGLGSLSSVGHNAGDLLCHVLAFARVRLGGLGLRLDNRWWLDALDAEELCLEDCPIMSVLSSSAEQPEMGGGRRGAGSYSGSSLPELVQ